LATIHRVLFIDNAVFYMDALFICLAIIVGVKRARDSFRSETLDLWPVLVFFFLLHYVFAVALVELNWPRYYAQALVASRIVTAMGVYAAGAYVWMRLRGSRDIADPAPVDHVQEDTN
jgi:hypothetical protein